MAHWDMKWFNLVKLDARQCTAANPLVINCKQGDKNYLRALSIFPWEFVDQFPEILFQQFSLVHERRIQRQAKYLAGIIGDEKCHRSMWLDTAEVFGITYQILESYRGKFPFINKLLSYLREQVSSALLFLRIVGVEIVAEMLSTELLSARGFVGAFDECGRTWFKAHVVHEGTTHEQIALNLALKELQKFRCGTREIETIVEHEIMEVVHLFDKAARNSLWVANDFAAMGMAA